MTLDINLFTPEVLATLEFRNNKINATNDTCVLLNYNNNNINSCTNCPFYCHPDECIIYVHQKLLAKHFPELLL